VTIAIRPLFGGGMCGPYTRFDILKKRIIFADGLEVADHIETPYKNSVLAQAALVAFSTFMAAAIPLTSN
jgi:hypothetical protein